MMCTKKAVLVPPSFRNTTGVTEEALKEFSMMFKLVVFWTWCWLVFVRLVQINHYLYLLNSGTSTRRSLVVWTTRSSSLVCARWATTYPWWKKENRILSSRPYLTLWIRTGLTPRVISPEEILPPFKLLIHLCKRDWLAFLICVCRDGNVSLQEYMAFMISRETENVKSSEEIESAFRALSTENKPYVTKEELYQVTRAHRSPCRSSESCRRAILTPLLFLSEPDQGAGGLLSVAHEALPRQQGSGDAVGFRLCRVHPLAFRQLIPRPPVTNRDAFSPHTHFHANIQLKLHDCCTRNTH